MNNSFHKDNLEALQKFQQMLNASPDQVGIESTPDGKARTLVISHVETTLDEMFFGHWRTENFKWERMANEVVGSIDLIVIHPISGYEIRRSGAASIVIMVDKAPQNIQGTERNRWALNAENKKSNALDLAFPKLKTECIKNAAVSLGKLFGRDLNRNNIDIYKPFNLKGKLAPMNKDMQYINELIDKAQTQDDCDIILQACPDELLAKVQELIAVKKHQLSLVK
jgi:hypothetical protein